MNKKRNHIEARLEENHKSNSIDRYIVSAEVTVLVAFVFVFQVELPQAYVRWLLLISFLLFSISLVLSLWYLRRQPVRFKYFLELSEITVEKYTDRILALVDGVFVPLARHEAKTEAMELLGESKSEKEFREGIEKLKKETESGNYRKNETAEKAKSYAIEALVFQMSENTSEDHKKAFQKPLSEKYSKFKFNLDKISFKFRRTFFISACIFLFFAIFVKLIAA